MDEDEARPILLAGPAAGPLAAPPRPGPIHPVAPAIAEVAAQVADRLQIGPNRDGHTEVRFGIERGPLMGVEVRLAETPRGVEVTFLTPTDSLRRALEAPLLELSQALADRGITAHHVTVTVHADVGDRRGRDPLPGDTEATGVPRVASSTRSAAAPLPLRVRDSTTDYVA